MFPAFVLPATAAVWLTPTQDNTWINGRIGGQIMERMSELLLDLTMLFGFSSGFFAVLSGWYPSATATKCAMQTTKISLKYAIFTYSTSHSLTHRDSIWGLTCYCSTYLPYYRRNCTSGYQIPQHPFQKVKDRTTMPLRRDWLWSRPQTESAVTRMMVWSN